MQAIVLVGGEGTRLRPLTESVPKPALTLVDRPFLAYMVEWLGSHGVTEVVLACGFLPDRLREALGEGEHEGIKLTYVVEPDRRGTAGAIRFAAEALGERLEQRFLALNGDVLTDLDLTALLSAHEEGRPEATIGLYAVEDSSAFGLVECDGDGCVVAFTEKTGRADPGEINAGAYVLERSVLDLVPPDREVSIEREVFPRLVGGDLRAAVLHGYWKDIGTPARYLEASWDILGGAVASEVRPTAPEVFVDPGAQVAPSATIGPRAVLSAGCTVGAGAEIAGSVLLPDCTVGEGARVRDSILSAGVSIAPGAEISDAVLGAGETIAAAG